MLTTIKVRGLAELLVDNWQLMLNHAEQHDSLDYVTTLKQLMHANSKYNQQTNNTQHSHYNKAIIT